MMKNLLLVSSFIAVYITACTSGSGDRVILGTFSNGADASLIRDQHGKWGIKISGEQTATFMQPKPVEIELYLSDTDIQQFSAGYDKIKKKDGLVTGEVTLKTAGGADFLVSDQWSVADGVVIMKRNLTVKGSQQDAGFYSAIRMMTNPEITWGDANFLAPGLLYGDPSYDGPTSPGGTSFDRAKIFTMREDYLPAPLFGMTLPDGDTFTILDMVASVIPHLKKPREATIPG